MMWLIRAGCNATYYDTILASQRVYLPWEGYHFDFRTLKTKEDCRLAVETEKNINNRISVATWVGQILDFTKKMQVGDYVLIPSKKSHTYALAVITGNYEYNADQCDCLQHSHTIKILITDVPRETFSQQIQYSLGAFRTVFRMKYENEILKAINIWENSHGGGKHEKNRRLS